VSPKRYRSLQRQTLLECLMARKDHPTAADVAGDMAKAHGPVSTSNVYRNLEILVAEGRVRRFRLDEGPDRFDANTAPHYHVVCTSCHRLSDMPIREGARLGLSLPRGFRASSWEITVRGLCAACAKASHPFLTKEV
jgi:Fe2+ or Zn2+ uptake regulation protein